MPETDREYYHRERLERERRDDVERERRFWTDVVEIKLQDGGNLPMAINTADQALRAFRERFQ
jgi:hypothetical protein